MICLYHDLLTHSSDCHMSHVNYIWQCIFFISLFLLIYIFSLRGYTYMYFRKFLTIIANHFNAIIKLISYVICNLHMTYEKSAPWPTIWRKSFMLLFLSETMHHLFTFLGQVFSFLINIRSGYRHKRCLRHDRQVYWSTRPTHSHGR